MDYETEKLFTNSHQSNSDFNKKLPDTNFLKRNLSRRTLKFCPDSYTDVDLLCSAAQENASSAGVGFIATPWLSYSHC